MHAAPQTMYRGNQSNNHVLSTTFDVLLATSVLWVIREFTHGVQTLLRNQCLSLVELGKGLKERW